MARCLDMGNMYMGSTTHSSLVNRFRRVAPLYVMPARALTTSSGSPRYQRWIWNVNEGSLPFLSLPCLAYPCLALPFQGLFRLKM